MSYSASDLKKKLIVQFTTYHVTHVILPTAHVILPTALCALKYYNLTSAVVYFWLFVPLVSVNQISYCFAVAEDLQAEILVVYYWQNIFLFYF